MAKGLEPDTEQLMRAASQGSAQARGQLLERHRERLKRMVAIRLDRRLASRVDSSDLVLPKWPDGIHPNNEGGALWAEKFWPFYEASRK